MVDGFFRNQLLVDFFVEAEKKDNKKEAYNNPHGVSNLSHDFIF